MESSNSHINTNAQFITEVNSEPDLRVRALKAIALVLSIILLIFVGVYSYLALNDSLFVYPRSLSQRNLILARNALSEAEKNSTHKDSLSSSGLVLAEAEARYLLALLDAKKFEEALKFEAELAEKDLDFAPVLYARSKVLEGDKMRRLEAFPLMRRAAKLADSGFGQFARVIWTDYALLLSKQGDYKQAYEEQIKAARLSPSTPELFVLAAKYAKEAKMGFEALSALNIAAGFDSTSAQARELLEEWEALFEDRAKAARTDAEEYLRGGGQD